VLLACCKGILLLQKIGEKRARKVILLPQTTSSSPEILQCRKKNLKRILKSPNNIQSLDLPHYFAKASRDLKSLRACSLVPQANPSFLASFSRICSALEHQALRHLWRA
jgi:hypothetical protein